MLNINLILSIVLIVGFVLLLIFVIWFFNSLKGLLKDSKNKDFIKVFRSIEEVQEKSLKDIYTLKKDLETFKEESKINISKVGLTKYNPFSEMGGNNSFSLVLLDSNKNGIIITSLHTRERTRLYLKEVSFGKSKLELSTDEQKALKDALK